MSRRHLNPPRGRRSRRRQLADGAGAPLGLFEIEGSPEFMQMVEDLGFEFCEVEDCVGMCGLWHAS